MIPPRCSMPRIGWSGLIVVLLVTAVAGCSGDRLPRGKWKTNVEAFRVELDALRQALDVPGIAYAIVEDGETVHAGAFGSDPLDDGRPFRTNTAMGIQSVTKSMVAIVIMQLVEQGLVDLETPVRDYLPDAEVPGDVLVRHVMTHTSEGVVGEGYVYGSSRYALLGDLIEAVTVEPLARVLFSRIVEPAGMEWFESPDLSASSGLISTVEQLALYLQALDRGRLLEPASMARLATASTTDDGHALPVSLGWFAQTLQGVPVMWSYGQAGDLEDSSLLLLRVPERRIALVVMANRNTMSDRFRLLTGEVGYSAFAMSFFRLFVASPPGEPLPRPDWAALDLAAELERLEQGGTYRYDGELVGQMLMRNAGGAAEESAALFELALEQARIGQDADPVIHFATVVLESPQAKPMGVEIGRQLLERDPLNRWSLLFQADLLEQTGDVHAASSTYQRILELPNQQHDFLYTLFRVWAWWGLAQIHRHDDPARAKHYVQQILDSGVRGEAKVRAERFLQALE